MSEQLKTRMVLVPKPEHYEQLSKCLHSLRYVVTQEDVEKNATLGEMWEINKEKG